MSFKLSFVEFEGGVKEQDSTHKPGKRRASLREERWSACPRSGLS